MDTTTTKHDEQDERLGGEFLPGADAILKYLIHLGVLQPDAEAEAVYYLKRTKRWPIGSDGGKLIASKSRLARHAQKIAAG